MIAAATTPDAGRVGRTVGLCFAAALAEGYDISSVGVAAPRMGPALALAHDQLGPVFSASIVGLLIGAGVVGRLADRVGRKRCLIGAMAVFSLFSAATAFATGFESLLLIRLCAGLGLGGAMPNLIALAAESGQERHRERRVTAMASAMPFGGVAAGAAAAALGWRDIFYLGGVYPLVVAVVMAAALPESQRFLSRAGSPAAASARLGLSHVLFGAGRARTTLVLWTASFAALLTLYTMINWLPTLMTAKGVSRPTASLIALLFNLGGGLGVLLLGALMDRPRRAWMLVIWNGALAGSLAVLAGAGAGLASAGSAAFMVGVFCSSLPIALYGLAAGFYAVLMRGSGVGASVAVGRMGAILGPLLAAALLARGAGPSGVLVAMVPIVAVAGAAILVLLTRPTVAD